MVLVVALFEELLIEGSSSIFLECVYVSKGLNRDQLQFAILFLAL